MKPYVVEAVGPVYMYHANVGRTPSPHVVPGTTYVRMTYIDSWSGPQIRVVDRIEDGKVWSRSYHLSHKVENGIFLLGDSEPGVDAYEYMWGNDTACFLKPMSECMFTMAGLRPGLVAQRYGVRMSDRSATHAFTHQGSEYRTLCHYNVQMRWATFLLLQPEVSCSYCRKKIAKGEVNHAGFMRAEV